MLTPFAIAHLRLLEIRNRFRTVKRRNASWHWVLWNFAAERGDYALSLVADDQKKFDHEVHGRAAH